MKSILVTFYILFLLNNVNSQAPDSCFRSAVYEHVIYIDPTSPIRSLDYNLEIFENVARKAAKYNVNLLVFPEYGIIPQYEKNDTLAGGVAAFLPQLNTNLCKNRSKVPNRHRTTKLNDQVVANNYILYRLSCLAAKTNMHIAVDLIELEKNLNRTNSSLNNQSDEYLMYNVLLVFDNKGSLIAKYRKYNLFGEPAMTQEKDPRISTFKNEFGKFGLAICADSLFENPIRTLVEKEKIDHLLFSTAWFDSFPFVNTLSFHSSLAIKYGINVLSSNNRNLPRGSTGSGIYSKNGVKIQTYADNTRLVISDLPKAKTNKSIDFLDNECSFRKSVYIGKEEYGGLDHLLKNQSMEHYNPVLTPTNVLKFKRLEKREDKIENFCAEDVCCDLEYKLTNGSNLESNYYYLTISSKKNHTHAPKLYQYEEGCSISSMNKEKTKYELVAGFRFEKLILKGRFNTTVIYPNILSNNLYIVSKKYWDFKQNKTQAEIYFDRAYPTLNFVSLFSRNYGKYIKDPFRG